MNKKGFYAAVYSFAGIMIVLAVIFSTVNNSKTEPQEGDNLMSNQPQTEISGNSSLYLDDYYSSYEEDDNSAVNASSDKKIPETTTQAQKSEPKKTTSSASSKAKTEPATQAATTTNDNNVAEFNLFDDSQEMIWPVNGKIVMDYSMETAVYDKTLDQYRTNDTICIEAEVGTPVCAAAEGIVENIYHDHYKGNCIVVNHGNGWLSTYGQLQTETSVTVGELVSAGTELGKIADSTPAENLLGPHLSFMVSKDNTPNDPKLLLAQLDE